VGFCKYGDEPSGSGATVLVHRYCEENKERRDEIVRHKFEVYGCLKEKNESDLDILY
jgi:hypothetical protein